MTSELRHPVYVWRDACIAYGGLSIEGTDAEYKAAAVIEAYGDEREAKGREEQAAELAKFKALAEALAETLAEALEPFAEEWDEREFLAQRHWSFYREASKAIAEYKEARDAS